VTFDTRRQYDIMQLDAPAELKREIALSKMSGKQFEE